MHEVLGVVCPRQTLELYRFGDVTSYFILIGRMLKVAATCDFLAMCVLS